MQRDGCLEARTQEITQLSASKVALRTYFKLLLELLRITYKKIKQIRFLHKKLI